MPSHSQLGSPVTPSLSNPPKDAALHLLCLAAEGGNHHQSHLLPSHQQHLQHNLPHHLSHHLPHHLPQPHPHHPNYPIYFPPPHYHQSPHYLYHPYHYTTAPTPIPPPPPTPPPQQQQQQQQQPQQPQTHLHQIIHSAVAYPHHQSPQPTHHLPYSPLLPSRPSPVLPVPLPVATPPLSPIPSHPVHKVKGPWRPEEDTILTELVSKFGPRRWTVIASHIPGRTGKQARERWLNQLSPHLAKRPWTPEEDRIVMDAHARLGNRWSEIAKLLDGRTDNATKNRFNTTIRRQISELSTHARQELAAGVKKSEAVATSMVTTASKTTTPSTSPNNSDGETDPKVGVKRKSEATSRLMEPLSQRPKTVTASS